MKCGNDVKALWLFFNPSTPSKYNLTNYNNPELVFFSPVGKRQDDASLGQKAKAPEA